MGAAERYREFVERVPAGVTVVVVTKFHPPSLVRELWEAGARDIGESRHQEAEAKADALADLPVVWHFVGQLQSKKARAALRYASVLHSLDRPSLLEAISGAGIDAFIQVNLTGDPARGGVAPAALPAFVERVVSTPGIRLIGLMAVAGVGREPRAEFARVRELRDAFVLPIAPAAAALSMGMSGDWEAAVAEGATHVRIGTAITGNRPERTYPRN